MTHFTRVFAALALLLLGLVVVQRPLPNPDLDSQYVSKEHRLVAAGCGLGAIAHRKACHDRGMDLVRGGAAIEAVTIGACGELTDPKMRILCVQHITDHWDGLDAPWRRCHREHDRPPAIRACLHAELFGKTD